MPSLYLLRYHIDPLAFRSLPTQSVALLVVKFFYEFWLQKHGVTFCYSFHPSGHNPCIAIEEMAAFSHYLENFSLIVTTIDEGYDSRGHAPSLKNVWANRVLELDKQDYSFLNIYNAGHAKTLKAIIIYHNQRIGRITRNLYKDEDIKFSTALIFDHNQEDEVI
ncbi:hypothetical protein [Pectobacterium brasiliense]|uniref:hypothetical protein n=1 Tax=Pectobacterium brasiliense TaxID=180957 RepID=UPI003B97F867